MRLYWNLLADLCGVFASAFGVMPSLGCSASLDSSVPLGDETHVKARRAVAVAADDEQNAESSKPQPQRESSTERWPTSTMTDTFKTLWG